MFLETIYENTQGHTNKYKSNNILDTNKQLTGKKRKRSEIEMYDIHTKNKKPRYN